MRGIARRLEKTGPTGETHAETKERAELRAVISAIDYQIWTAQGFVRVVIAADSSYVVDGVTEGVKDWQQNGWVKEDGTAVENKDLWQKLLLQINRNDGMEVYFWCITPQQNAVTIREAEVATEQEKQVGRWTRYWGSCF